MTFTFTESTVDFESYCDFCESVGHEFRACPERDDEQDDSDFDYWRDEQLRSHEDWFRGDR